MTDGKLNTYAASRRWLLKALAGTAVGMLLPFGRVRAQDAANFPAVGRRYLVDFRRFRVELYFGSLTSLTYRGVRNDGTRGQPETVAIGVEPIATMIFLVTWQEADKTTVVHVEDYVKRTIVTNITNPDLTFEQYHGTFTELP